MFTLLFVALVACQTVSSAGSLEGMSGNPTVFCNVVDKPEPILMGGWRCLYVRYMSESHQFDTNQVEYRLIKHGEQYALYFYRTAHGGKKKYIGWQNWTINGNEISSDTGVKISAQNGNVYFSLGEGTPEKMTRSGSP